MRHKNSKLITTLSSSYRSYLNNLKTTIKSKIPVFQNESEEDRLNYFKHNPHARFWWFKQPNHNFLPPIYSFLHPDEWQIMKDWFEDTEQKQHIGEMNVPLITFIYGLIMGSGIRNIIQLGHYAGYSTLLIGYMLKRINAGRLATIDIDENMSIYTKSWITKADLSEQVKVITGDSSGDVTIKKAVDYVKNLSLLIIDSSHQYKHTLVELSKWSKRLDKGGFILLHDTSKYAATFDKTQLGGVEKALEEWSKKNSNDFEIINMNHQASLPTRDIVYSDTCGLGIIQKKL